MSGNLILINLLIFLVLSLYDRSLFSPSPEALIFFGASDPILLVQGEFWRLLTANFLHSGILHIWFNTIGLKFIGLGIERLLGRKLFLFIYIVSGLYAMLASVFFNISMSVGASGAIFGLVGVGVVFESLYKISDETFLHQTNTWKESFSLWLKKRPFLSLALLNMLLAFAINTLAVFFSFNIRLDNAAHIGGMFAGGLIFYGVTLLLPKRKSIKKILKAGSVFILFFSSFLFFSYAIFFTDYIKKEHVEKAQDSLDAPLQYYHYTQALRLDPMDEELLFKRGVVSLLYGDIRGSIRDIQEAILLGFPKEKFSNYIQEFRVLGKEKEAKTLELILTSNF